LGGESGFASKWGQKLNFREIMSIDSAVPWPLQWSEVPIFNGGSGLNILFTSTLKKMGLDITDMLTPSEAPFYARTAWIIPAQVC
jgi:hypothetical protein